VINLFARALIIATIIVAVTGLFFLQDLEGRSTNNAITCHLGYRSDDGADGDQSLGSHFQTVWLGTKIGS